MKYCVEFTLDFPYKEEISEYRIKYNGHDKKVVEFLDYAQDKRVIIELDKDNLSDFILQNKFDFYSKIENKNFVIKLPLYNEILKPEDTVKKFKECGLSVFFADTVTSIDVLHGFLEMGVTDIYIAGELAFDLKDISQVIHAYNTNIRVYPNVAQSLWNDTTSLKSFFIRPEDMHFYEDYIDIIEFYGDKKDHAWYYKIYTIDKKWFGDLSALIIGFRDNIHSYNIMHHFGERRTRCGKRCMKGGKCNLCTLTQELDSSLTNKNLILKKK